MANKIDICNSALDKLGAESISSFSDGTKAANLCARNYDKLRRKLLRSHWWNFAIVRETWSADSNTPAWGYDTQFVVPDTCLRFLTIENFTLPYSIENGKLMTSYSGSDINVLYVEDYDDVNGMPTDFQEGLAYLLASEIAYPLLQSQNVSTLMYEKFKEEISGVRTIDSQISGTGGMYADHWNDSRNGGGLTSGRKEYYWD